MERPNGNEIITRSPLELRNVLLNGGTLMVDLDDTIKEALKFEWPDGIKRRILPETVEAFKTVHAAGIRLGIATEQAFSEIEPFLTDVTRLTLGEEHTDPYELFNGLIIGEGGSVVRRPATDEKNAEIVVVAPKQAQADRLKLLDWLENNLQESDIEGWKSLPDTDPHIATYVQLPSEDDQGIATISLWEKGPHITEDPSYVEKYAFIGSKLENVLQELGVTTLKIYEAGNGTLRIVPRTASKAHTVELLAAVSSTGAVDRSKIVYACDGPNDVALAMQLKMHGGSVIAVGNAVAELHAIADFSATQTAGKGFAEAIATILPNQRDNRNFLDLRRILRGLRR